MASRTRNASSRTKSHSHPNPPPRKCSCSPTTHPGSFRCSMHKKPPRAVAAARPSLPRSPSSSSNPYHHSESSMAAKANSLKEILHQIIKQQPSSRDLHRRKSFQPKPTRFWLMNRNTETVAVS